MLMRCYICIYVALPPSLNNAVLMVQPVTLPLVNVQRCAAARLCCREGERATIIQSQWALRGQPDSRTLSSTLDQELDSAVPVSVLQNVSGQQNHNGLTVRQPVCQLVTERWPEYYAANRRSESRSFNGPHSRPVLRFIHAATITITQLKKTWERANESQWNKGRKKLPWSSTTLHPHECRRNVLILVRQWLKTPTETYSTPNSTT